MHNELYFIVHQLHWTTNKIIGAKFIQYIVQQSNWYIFFKVNLCSSPFFPHNLTIWRKSAEARERFSKYNKIIIETWQQRKDKKKKKTFSASENGIKLLETTSFWIPFQLYTLNWITFYFPFIFFHSLESLRSVCFPRKY